MTFLCDETMVITIPVGMRDMPGEHSVPEKFHCVFRDFYKVFVINGKPKPLGVSLIILSRRALWFNLQKALMRLFFFISFSQAAQAIGGVFIGALAVIMFFSGFSMGILSVPTSLMVNIKIYIRICSTEMIMKNIILYLIFSVLKLVCGLWFGLLRCRQISKHACGKFKHYIYIYIYSYI